MVKALFSFRLLCLPFTTSVIVYTSEILFLDLLGQGMVSSQLPCYWVATGCFAIPCLFPVTLPTALQIAPPLSHAPSYLVWVCRLFLARTLGWFSAQWGIFWIHGWIRQGFIVSERKGLLSFSLGHLALREKYFRVSARDRFAQRIPSFLSHAKDHHWAERSDASSVIMFSWHFQSCWLWCEHFKDNTSEWWPAQHASNDTLGKLESSPKELWNIHTTPHMQTCACRCVGICMYICVHTRTYTLGFKCNTTDGNYHPSTWGYRCKHQQRSVYDLPFN